MVALVKITQKPIVSIRFFIELTVLSIGWLLRGTVGIGTFITLFGIGFCIQLVFKIFNFDINELKHKNIKDCFAFLNK